MNFIPERVFPALGSRGGLGAAEIKKESAAHSEPIKSSIRFIASFMSSIEAA